MRTNGGGGNAWRAKNKDRVRELQRAWRDNNKDRVAELSRRWRSKNPEAAKIVSRREKLKRQYGITPEQYQAMLTAQGGGCGICGVTGTESSRALCVDHDHATAKVRGLLCSDCNVALGRFKDNVASLLAAERYLQFHKKLKLLHGT